ncbi:lipoyl(octanoyl) transferase LipB [Candidatus Bipolaricaulota bacterium]|nr:lipoyl(octanoyl) transferase LipB [Candidatus Bipolaricaulota bacterium]
MNPNSTIGHVALGHGDYGDVLALQRTLHAKRCAGELGDLLLSVEHNPVFTLGRSGMHDHILVAEDTLKQQGIQIHEIERGGDITYHGPGQLVVYPIFDLRGFGKDIHRFIWSLEEAIIQTLSELGIGSARNDGFPGVWVGARKIASIGVYVKNWVTYHGLALNVDVNQAHFRMIRPCGLSIETVSLNDIRDLHMSVAEVGAIVVRQLGALLEKDIVTMDRKEVI